MIKTIEQVKEKYSSRKNIHTIEQVRDKLNRVVDLLDVISFRRSISFKDYKIIKKVEKFLFRLTHSVITNNEGVLML